MTKAGIIPSTKGTKKKTASSQKPVRSVVRKAESALKRLKLNWLRDHHKGCQCHACVEDRQIALKGGLWAELY